MFLPLSQQLCQSQGHRCHTKSHELFWSVHQSNSQHGGPMWGGSMLRIDWTTCCFRCPFAHSPNPQMRTLDKNTETQIALCVLPADVHSCHFKVAGFCGVQSWFLARKHDHHVIKTGFRQIASVRTPGLQLYQMLPQTSRMKKIIRRPWWWVSRNEEV